MKANFSQELPLCWVVLIGAATHTSVEHDPVSRSRSNPDPAIQNRSRIGLV